MVETMGDTPTPVSGGGTDSGGRGSSTGRSKLVDSSRRPTRRTITSSCQSPTTGVYAPVAPNRPGSSASFSCTRSPVRPESAGGVKTMNTRWTSVCGCPVSRSATPTW